MNVDGLRWLTYALVSQHPHMCLHLQLPAERIGASLLVSLQRRMTLRHLLLLLIYAGW